MNKSIYRTIFFFGWLLSPLTTWNDLFINIPLAYVLSCITIYFVPASFVALMVIYYWLTNILGLALMAMSGRHIFHDRKHMAREAVKLIAPILLYSAILIMLDKVGILKPIQVFLTNR